MNLQDLANIGSVIGLLLTAVGLFLNWWENRRSHRLTFFADYTKRYQEIMVALPYDVLKLDFDPSKIKEQEQKVILSQMIAYFALCSEEFDLKNEGFVKRRIWDIWAEGIISNLQKPAFRWGWEEVKNQFDFFPDFKNWVSQWVVVPIGSTSK